MSKLTKLAKGLRGATLSKRQAAMLKGGSDKRDILGKTPPAGGVLPTVSSAVIDITIGG